MKNEFLKNLKSYNLEGFGVLLAVSGGKDSMTMLDLFNYFKYELKLNLVVCHFNHSLRDDADRDEKFVKTQCEKYGLKFYSKKEDVLLYSNENKLSTEEGARFLRYKFFDEVKRIENLEYIATAHNKNDLAETVIMRILRGTGINGLIGIQSERGDLIRPILNFSRDEIEKYIEENNIPFVEDKTNLILEFWMLFQDYLILLLIIVQFQENILLQKKDYYGNLIKKKYWFILKN